MLSLVVLLFYDDADPVVTPSRVVFHLVVDLDPFFPFLFTEISLVSTERGLATKGLERNTGVRMKGWATYFGAQLVLGSTSPMQRLDWERHNRQQLVDTAG